MKLIFESEGSEDSFEVEVTDEQAAILEKLSETTGKTIEELVIEAIQQELSSSQETK